MSTLIIDEQNAHFLPNASLLFFDCPTSSYFFSFRKESLSSFGGRPNPENAMHSPRTRRLTVLDTNTLKYGPESTSMQVKFYARASRPGLTTFFDFNVTRNYRCQKSIYVYRSIGYRYS